MSPDLIDKKFMIGFQMPHRINRRLAAVMKRPIEIFWKFQPNFSVKVLTNFPQWEILCYAIRVATRVSVEVIAGKTHMHVNFIDVFLRSAMDPISGKSGGFYHLEPG